jgi:hypothetical protein
MRAVHTIYSGTRRSSKFARARNATADPARNALDLASVLSSVRTGREQS